MKHFTQSSKIEKAIFCKSIFMLPVFTILTTFWLTVYNFTCLKWRSHTFDRFANSKNCKVEKINSQFWTPGTSGVDAFVYDWSSDNNWLVPPVHCIPNVLKHMLFYKCVGTLVVPKWKSALFWPCIALEHKFKWFVKDVIPKRFFSEDSHKERNVFHFVVRNSLSLYIYISSSFTKMTLD
jgi:hypothetical protein